MSLKVSEVKEIDEEFLYSRRSRDKVLTLVILFLKDNKENAYTSKEISKELNKNIPIEFNKDMSLKIGDQSIWTALDNAIKADKSLKRKGSYYWYEEPV